MGTWGYGPFDNDDAMDFLGALQQGDGDATAEVSEEFELPDFDEYLEAPGAARAIAAAALVAIAHSGAELGQPPEAAKLLAARPLDTSQNVRSAAAAALMRVFSDDSELPELWEREQQTDEFAATIDRIRAGL